MHKDTVMKSSKLLHCHLCSNITWGVFLQDNARPHTARHTQGFLRRNNVQLLPWPARSPDLSPIEHLWDHLGRRVRENHDVDDVRDLERALRVEWARIPLRVIRKLICSMRRQCLTVLACNGGHTRYWTPCEFWRLTPNVFQALQWAKATGFWQFIVTN